MNSEKANDYDFAEETGTLSDMDAGKDDGATIGSGEVGEIAKVEIGETGKGIYSEYERLALGGIPDSQLKTKKSRVDGNLQNASAADVPKSTKVRFRITDKRRSRTYSESRWFDKSELEAGSIENLPLLEWEGWDDAVFGKAGRVLVLEARNPSSSFNIDTSNSDTEFPFIGGY
jgi:hypothetical protein